MPGIKSSPPPSCAEEHPQRFQRPWLDLLAPCSCIPHRYPRQRLPARLAPAPEWEPSLCHGGTLFLCRSWRGQNWQEASGKPLCGWMWWEGWKKPLERDGSGVLANAPCHLRLLCCPSQSAIQRWGLAQLVGTWRGRFPTRGPHCSSSSLPGGGFEMGMLSVLHLGKPKAKGHPLLPTGGGDRGLGTGARWQRVGDTCDTVSTRSAGPAGSPGRAAQSYGAPEDHGIEGVQK